MTGPSAPLILDGAHMEGGGALVRTALAMSALTQQPVRIQNVRGNASTPGLNAEDLTIARALGLAGAAEIKGEFGDHDLVFAPARRAAGLNERIEPETGATTDPHSNALVVLHSLLPVMAKSGVYSKITSFGETFGHHVLSYDYFVNVTLGAHRRFGLYAYPELSLAGFGRGSRGEVRLEIEPSMIHGVDWANRGQLISCCAVVATAELAPNVSSRAASHLSLLAGNAKLPLQIENFNVRSRSTGAFVTIFAEFENGFGGATAMGRRGLRMEAVAQSAFDTFLEWYKGDWTVDPFLADQLLVTAVLAETDTQFSIQRITERFLTTVWVIKQFLPVRITVRGHEGEEGWVTVRR
jgi:RNA 3'-phosphate cyclase